MKHAEPPANLPLVEEPPEDLPVVGPEEVVPFREDEPKDTMWAPKTDADQKPRLPYEIGHSQLKQRDMDKFVETRDSSAMLDVGMVAERLRVAKAAVYRLVARRRVQFYRLPSGLRFKLEDIQAFLESRRESARLPKRHGRT